MDETDTDHSEDRGPRQWVKIRLQEFFIGLAAHSVRPIALIMNAFLLGAALSGVGGLLIISLIERQLLHKIDASSRALS